MKKSATPEAYIESHSQWKNELEKLRSIMLRTGLDETIKWGAPVYTWNKKNIVGLGAFQSYVSIWFFQGVFLKDPKKVLVNAQEGKTKGLRQWRFSATEEIEEKTILEYVAEAIQNQKEGKEIKPQKSTRLVLPEELANYLANHREAASAFEQFTPGKKREFSEYINEAKREATRMKRLDKIVPMILQGQGLNDRYK